MIEVICPYCSKEAKLVNGDEIYPHRNDLYDLKFYLCRPCEAYVGVHKSGEFEGKPFGTLAKKELRKIRNETHKVFDGFWQRNKIRRHHAYGQLAKAMGIEKDDCHIGMFNIDQCKKVIQIVEDWEEYNRIYKEQEKEHERISQNNI